MHHYATLCLTEAERLELTERGKEICRGVTAFLPYAPGMEAKFDEKLMRGILSFLKTLALIRIEPSVSDLLKKIGSQHSLDRDYIYAHVLWLMKYGYISLSKSKPR